jgi:selenocysteine-specific elongation factor
VAGEAATALLRLDAPVAASVGDRFVVRRPSPGQVVAGGIVLDPLPPTGLARRRLRPERLAALQSAVAGGDADAVIAALLGLHGALSTARCAAVTAAVGRRPGNPTGPGLATGHPQAPEGGAADPHLAPDVAADLATTALASVAARHARDPLASGLAVAELRLELAARVRRLAGLPETIATAAAASVLERLVAEGRLVRDGERVRDAARPAGPPPELVAAMERLEHRLSAPAPSPLSRAAREAGCPPEGVRALETAGRIVRVELDLAWAAPTYQRLAATALAMARRGPLSPAAFRDATGTSRRYVLAILEDLDRRGILQRGPDGHRPGPRAPAASAPAPTSR